MKVYVFKGKSGVHGLTDDISGGKLPSQHGPWKLEKTIEMNEADPPKIGVSNKAFDDIKAKGYHLAKPIIILNDGLK